MGATTYLGHAGQGVTGLLHGDTRQFLCQLMGATLYAVWAFGATFVVFWSVNNAKSMRVAPEARRRKKKASTFPSLACQAIPKMRWFRLRINPTQYLRAELFSVAGLTRSVPIILNCRRHPKTVVNFGQSAVRSSARASGAVL